MHADDFPRAADLLEHARRDTDPLRDISSLGLDPVAIGFGGERSLAIVLVRCTPTPTGLLRWKIRFDTSHLADITVVVRMDMHNRAPFDYYLFPRIDVASERLRLAEDNDLHLDAYRFDTLDFFYDITAPVAIPEAA